MRLIPLVLSVLTPLLIAAAPAGPVYDSPETAKADADYAIQGEYSGAIPGDMGQQYKIGLQVIALGGGRFSGMAYQGGLPGDGWDGMPETRHAIQEARAVNGVVIFANENASAMIRDNQAHISFNGVQVASLNKAYRGSSTLGAKPPEGAVVLFDGTEASLSRWQDGAKITEDGLLMQGVTSNATFGDHRLHIEFRLPYQPEARGQGRGNSGVYLQGRYEVQMLDSFALEGLDNECGGLYKIARPAVNMCYPPLTWQTYDVEFTAARFDADGKKTAHARITVLHNGVKIHDGVELPAPTTAAPLAGEQGPGPVYLQDHGNPVRYRNIWVVEKK